MPPLLKRINFVLDVVAACMFLAIFGTIVAQTAMRYILRQPLTTSLEFATIGFIWLVFWAASLNLAINDHVRFDIVYNLFPEPVRRFLSILTNLAFAAVFVLAAKATFEYFDFLRTQTTASLRISYQLAFGPYFIFFAVLPARMLINVAVLLTPGWRERI